MEIKILHAFGETNYTEAIAAASQRPHLQAPSRLGLGFSVNFSDDAVTLCITSELQLRRQIIIGYLISISSLYVIYISNTNIYMLNVDMIYSYHINVI